MNWNLPDKRLNPYIAFHDYVNIKLHFNGQVEYIGPYQRLKIPDATIKSRNDFGIFRSIVDKYDREDYLDLLVSCLMRNKSFHVSDLDDLENTTYHKKRMKRVSAIYRTFTKEVEQVIEAALDEKWTLKQLLTKNGSPYIIQFSDKIVGGTSYETLALLNTYFDFCSVGSNDPWWESERNVISKYQTFCQPSGGDSVKYDKVVDNLISQLK